MTRPASLAEVAAWATDIDSFRLHLADFLDEFRSRGGAGRLAEESRRLPSVFSGGEVADAYLAAVAVALSREIGVFPPPWAWSEDRKLRRPWFASPGASVRAMLLWESPAAFRERNLFVSENALSRA